MFDNTHKIACAALAALCTLGTISAPAQAETVEFAFSPAELADPGALHERIRRAARHACGSASPLLPIEARRSCRADIEAQLVDRIGDPRLTAKASRPTALAQAAAR